MKRIVDLVVGLSALVMLVVPIVMVAILVKLTSKGSMLYWSNRVGHNNKLFRMPKFRTMQMDTPEMATHLMNTPDTYLSPIGRFLRRSSLDELPQLWSILKGDMSIVGPRPALFNQDDLVSLRTESGVNRLIPGLTGWAQVNGRDTLPIPEKVALDVEYMERQSFWLDMYIIWLTMLKVVRRDGVSH
jgi:O-antigen biosynthesis protein WbqP